MGRVEPIAARCVTSIIIGLRAFRRSFSHSGVHAYGQRNLSQAENVNSTNDDVKNETFISSGITVFRKKAL